MTDVPAAAQPWLIACLAAIACVVLIGGFVFWLAVKAARIKPPTPVKPADRKTKDNR